MRTACPKCGEQGNGPYAKTIAAKGRKYRHGSYFAHPFKGEGGKWRVRWCYVPHYARRAAVVERVEAVRKAFNEMITRRLVTSLGSRVFRYSYERFDRGKRGQAWEWYRHAFQGAVRDLGVSGRTIRRRLYRPVTQEMRESVLLAVSANGSMTDAQIMKSCGLSETETLMILWRSFELVRVRWDHEGVGKLRVSLSKDGTRRAAGLLRQQRVPPRV